MAKADPKRNYYADLELDPNASTDDVKRAYKKLALKFHPDRNAGREVECVPKFQAIQAAFEILTDPQQKAKYDAERRRFNVYAASSASSYRTNPAAAAAKPNPYTTPTRDFSNFPPPPRRTDPKHRTYDWTAPGNRPTPPKPQPSQSRPVPNPPPQPAPSGADRFARFAKPPTAQRPTAQEDAQARANNFSAWQHMAGGHKGKPAQDNEFAKAQAAQTQNPYRQSQYGQPPLGRSQSTRTPRKAGFDPATPGADEPQAAGASGYYTTNRSSVHGFHTHKAADIPTPASSGEEDPPFNEGMARTRMPYHGGGGERTPFDMDAFRRPASQRNSPNRPDSGAAKGYHTDQSSRRSHRSVSPVSRRPFSEAAKTSPHTSRQQPRSKQGGNATKPFFAMYDDSSEGEIPHKTAEPRPKANTKAPYQPKHADEPTEGLNKGSRSQSSIFSMPVTDDMFASKPNNFKSRSTDSISTKFTPDDWTGKFEGNRDYFNMPPPSRKGGNSKASPGNAKANGPAVPNTMPPPPPPPIRPTVDTSATDPTEPTRFSATEWQQTDWALHPEPTNPPSPTKQPRRTKMPKSRKTTTIPATVPKPATVSDATEENGIPQDEGLSNGSSESVGSFGDSAMDIDSEVPAQPTMQASPETVKGARKVTTAPTRSDWQEPKRKPVGTANTAAPLSSPTRQTSQASAKPGDASFGFGTFQNVAPFASSSADGINHLSDLGSSLPFPSAASKAHPAQKDASDATGSSNGTSLVIPKPPRPPAEPSRLTRTSWVSYMHNMQTYLSEWNKFNTAMVTHFNARQSWVDRLADRFNGPYGWVGALGDVKDGGFQSYMEALQEDDRVREHWNVACEKHKTAMEKCGRLRDQVLRAESLPMV